MTGDQLELARTLLEAPSPAVVTTYRKDGSANVAPVWFQWTDGWVEVVVLQDDVKLRHLARDPRCVLVVFETSYPFRGVEIRGVPDLVEGDVTEARTAIASRYLGPDGGKRFAEDRINRPGVRLRMPIDEARVWDLAAILPPMA